MTCIQTHSDVAGSLACRELKQESHHAREFSEGTFESLLSWRVVEEEGDSGSSVRADGKGEGEGGRMEEREKREE